MTADYYLLVEVDTTGGLATVPKTINVMNSLEGPSGTVQMQLSVAVYQTDLTNPNMIATGDNGYESTASNQDVAVAAATTSKDLSGADKIFVKMQVDVTVDYIAVNTGVATITGCSKFISSKLCKVSDESCESLSMAPTMTITATEDTPNS